MVQEITRDLGVTLGMAGQVISMSGFFAAATSLSIATLVLTVRLTP